MVLQGFTESESDVRWFAENEQSDQGRVRVRSSAKLGVIGLE